MAPLDKYTLKNLENAMCHFNTGDLKLNVMPVFPEFTWREIRDSVVDEKLPLIKRSISKMVTKKFGEMKPAENDIKKRICSLKLIEVSTYPGRRLWSAFHLGRRSADAPLDLTELDASLGRALRAADLQCLRQVTVNDGLFWVMILPTKRGKWTRAVTIQTPAFYAYAHGSPHLFAARKKGSQNQAAHLEALRVALGYTKVKHASLEGTEPKSLLQMLKCRQEKSVDVSTMLLDPPQLGPPDIRVERGNITISERAARREYAEKIFGKNPPVLKTFTLHAPDMQPPDERWGEEPIDVKLTFMSSNVFETMKDLTASGVLKTPFPPYMHSITTKGKNVVQLRGQKRPNVDSRG